MTEEQIRAIVRDEIAKAKAEPPTITIDVADCNAPDRLIKIVREYELRNR